MRSSLLSFLSVLIAIAVFVSAQDCPEGTHLSDEYCCPDGTDYQSSADKSHGTCCPDGSTYRYGSLPRGTCCTPDFDEYDEKSNQCIKRWKLTQSWWTSHVNQYFQINGQWVKIVEGGFEIDGVFNKYETGGITVGGVKVTIEDGYVLVNGQRVPLSATGPSSGSQTGGTGGVAGIKPVRPVKPSKPETQQPIVDGGGEPPKPQKEPCHGTGTGIGQGGPVKPGSQGPSGGQKVTTGSTDACGCSSAPSCNTDTHLGIKYGKCYNIIDVNGLPLNRDTGGVYQSGGDVGNLVFRICKSTSDCSADLGNPVPQHNGKFFLQDQLGWKDWQGPAWWGWNWPHFAINRKSVAVTFVGEGMCIFGGPAVCLRDGEKGRGMAAPCPLGGNAAMAHIYYTNNPNSCKAFRFEETKCLSNMVEEKN